MISVDNKEIVFYSAFADFIPFAFYYDYDSVITKNGELIKIIKLNKSASNTDIRRIISSFISDLDSTDISIWLTTIRSSNSKNFQIDNTSGKNVLSEKFEKRKQEVLDTKFLEDEFYISIVINDRVDLITLKNIVSVISTFNRDSYQQRLQHIYKRLSKIIGTAFDKLLEFNPKILSIIEIDGQYISEIESFFSRITRSSNVSTKLDKHDISSRLIQSENIKVLENKIAFNHDQDSELFCSTFSVKNHPPITEEIIKNLLDNQFEMTITEIIIPKHHLEKKYNYYKVATNKFTNLIKISSDKNLLDYTNLNIQHNRYYLKQTIFSVFAGKNDIDYISYRMNEKFAKHGIQACRENVALEEVFWSQFPGNFGFVTRLQPTSKTRLCNFSRSNVMRDSWYNSMVFPDYIRKEESFAINQQTKNISIVFAESEVTDYMLYFLTLNILSSPKLKLKVINFATKSFQIDSKEKINIQLKDTTLEQQTLILKLFTNYLSLLQTDKINQEVIANITNTFFKKDLNQKNLLNSLMENGLMELKSISEYEDNQFYNVENLSSQEYFSLLIINCLIGAIDKLLNKIDYIFQCSNIKTLLEDGIYQEKLSKLSELVILDNIYLYFYYEGSADIITKLNLKKRNLLLMFYLNKNQKAVYAKPGCGFNNDIVGYIDFLLNKENNIIMFNFDNKIYFTELDIKGFFDKGEFSSSKS